ncbi:unnamed protein product [Rhizoctonia solani]|uniref:Uncharacterized protein n=1 Tax=Rhizoctonia solani TaxID=456999 RepID=A0A8H3BGC7_9AGAM|nr:unnamed protein product [Rhizoctonia solani]
MFFNPSTILAVLSVFSAVPAYAELPAYQSSLPSVRRSLASKLERRAQKIQRQNDAQTSLTLVASQVAKGLANNGQQGGGDPGQVPSLTSTNNLGFARSINFCLTQNVPLTNGQQVKGGSCNGMGRIIASTKMPSAKFVNPKNGATIQANTAFTIQMAISNMVTGNFVNPNTNYYSAPQRLCPLLDLLTRYLPRIYPEVDGSGTVIGHSHVTVELLSSLDQTTVTNPQKFAFFKGLNNAAQGGVLTADVTAGLPAGAYRMCSINSAANHRAAPPVTAGGRGFLINGDSFINKNGALQRSCDIQKNTCATAANSSGNKAPLTVAACETQAQQCSAAIA